MDVKLNLSHEEEKFLNEVIEKVKNLEKIQKNNDAINYLLSVGVNAYLAMQAQKAQKRK